MTEHASASKDRGRLAVETIGLTKRFGSQLAVDDVALQVPTGSVFGFLGPNGSGKTTTIRMLLGLAAPTTGTVNLLGSPMPAELASVLPMVGALVEGPAFYPYLSGTANLVRLDTADRYASSQTRRSRVHNAIERVGLTQAAKKNVKAFSLGMKQRLGIANALLTPRQLLILDEPTNGLDPQGTREVRSLIRSLAADGTTIFVSSHLLAEIEQVCSHAAVMSAGRLVAQGTLDELRGGAGEQVRIQTPDVAAAVGVLERLGLIAEAGSRDDRSDDSRETHTLVGRSVTTTATRSAIEPDIVVAALVSAGVRVRGFAFERPTLEDRFVELTGEGFDVAS